MEQTFSFRKPILQAMQATVRCCSKSSTNKPYEMQPSYDMRLCAVTWQNKSHKVTHSTICYTTPKQPPEGNNAVLVLHKYTTSIVTIALMFCVVDAQVHSAHDMKNISIFKRNLMRIGSLGQSNRKLGFQQGYAWSLIKREL